MRRDEFWLRSNSSSSSSSNYLSQKEKLNAITNIFESASVPTENGSTSFLFHIGKTLVCEHAVAGVLGALFLHFCLSYLLLNQ